MFRRPAVLAAALAATFVLPAPAFAHNGGADAISVEGTLQFTHSDNFRTKTARYYYTLRRGNKQIRLQFRHRRQDLANGMRLSVRGMLYKGRLHVDHVHRLSRAPRSFATVSPGPRKVAVLLFNFTNDTSQPWTPAQAAATMFTGPGSVNQYFQEESYGAISMTGDVYGWYTLPMTNSGCAVGDWAKAANTAAASAGVNLAGYQHVIYAFPFASSCYWSGLAEMPGSRVWINGYFMLQTLGHELSHNLGVHHASSLTCLNGGSRVAYSNSCSYSEYGDPFDIMGSGARQTSVYHKGQIGWLDPLAQQTITTSGTYTISPMEWLSGGVQALRIPRGSSGQYFYLEYRRPYGSYFDTFSLADPVVNGVTIRLAPDYSVINLSYLIDANPITASFSDAPLRAGQTFTDSLDGITISTTSVTAAGATVQVTLPGSTPPPPPPPPPADTVAPSAPGTLSGSVVSGPAVALAWGAASDNTGVAGYRVYRGITQIGTASGTTYTDPSPAAGTTQSYSVRAFDAAGNLGPSGNTLSVTIPSSTVTPPPPPPPPPPTSGDAPVNQVLPAVKGTLLSGATVTASTGTWTGAAPMTYTYTWQRCGLLGSCVVIAGATSATYVLGAWEVGRRLKVTVTATNAKGTSAATSALTGLVGRGAASTPARTRDEWNANWAETALAIAHAPLARH
jgi:hypothetical protein